MTSRAQWMRRRSASFLEENFGARDASKEDPKDAPKDAPSLKRLELFKVFSCPDALEELRAVLTSGTLTQGPRVARFEEELRAALGARNVATVNSATSGLQLALRALRPPFGDWPGLQPGDEVLTPALTCTATNWPVLHEGLVPHWLDSDLCTASTRVEDVVAKLSPRTKVIQVVHWGGTPVAVERLGRLLDEAAPRLGFRPVVVEDCAHAFGMRYLSGAGVGCSGNVCVFSFQAIKLLTTGDGGLVVTPETPFGAHLLARCRLLRWFGVERERPPPRAEDGQDFRLEEDVPEAGFKFHMNDVNAAIGLGNLPRVAPLLDRARANARELRRRAAPLTRLRWLGHAEDPEASSCWLLSLWVDDKPAFLRHCAARRIVASQVHKRNDRHSCVAGCRGAPLPAVDELEAHLICVPVGWWLDAADLERVAVALEDFEAQPDAQPGAVERPATAA